MMETQENWDSMADDRCLVCGSSAEETGHHDYLMSAAGCRDQVSKLTASARDASPS